MQRRLLWCLIACLSLGWSAQAATDGGAREDFEGTTSPDPWSFSNGGEFPGASGSFSRSPEAAHAGRLGGRLQFDFTHGGRYVAAGWRLPAAELTNGSTGVELWLRRPEGSDFVFRYTDGAGQTFQKTVDCPGGRWTHVTIPFDGWAVHWGGANDGRVRGGPQSLAFNVDRGEETTGALWLDDLRLVNRPFGATVTTWPAYRFVPAEGWRSWTEGNGGASHLEGAALTADFSHGAAAVHLVPPDHALPGDVRKIRLRLRGSGQPHPVRLELRTHFMTFMKTIGEFAGTGEQELVMDAPPGPGWEWRDGENDGKLHGPLRLGEIRLGGGGSADRCEIELREILIDGSTPRGRECLLVAETRGEGKSAEWVARLRAVSPEPIHGRLGWVLRDWDGAQIGSGEREMVAPARAEAVEQVVPVPPEATAGRRFVEAEFQFEREDGETAPARAVWLAPMERGRDARLDPESPFGMGVYLNRYGGDAGGLELMERAAEMARDAGVKWSREDFSWERIEPARGRFEWAYYDRLVERARRNGISVYAIVGYWTHWTKPYTAEGIEDYTRFLRALVEHYKGEIHEWEIWNEPNIFFWQGPKDLYAELLRRSYAVVKEVDPGARVLGLSTSGIDREFIARMLELKAPFDVLTIHPYRTRLNDQVFIQDLKDVSDQARRADGTRRPVWLTEMGWATHQPHNTQRQDFTPTTLRGQAELIARSYLCAIVSGVEPRTFWYDFRNDGDDPVYFEHQMGIMTQDFRPKPAYAAYAALTGVLEGKRLVGRVVAAPGVLAFRFQRPDGGGETIAAWSPRTDARFALPDEAGAPPRWVRVNTLGERRELPAGARDVDLRRGAPVYLIKEPRP